MPYRTTPKMAMRKRAHRKSLILAAIQLFAQRGYHATTVLMIAKAARSSNGGFYCYFRGKDDVCAAILESLVTAVARTLRAAVARTTPGTPQQLRSTVNDLVQLLAANPDVVRILLMESSASGARLEKARRDIIEGCATFFAQLLAQWQRLRSTVPSPPVALSAAFTNPSVIGSSCRQTSAQPRGRSPLRSPASASALSPRRRRKIFRGTKTKMKITRNERWIPASRRFDLETCPLEK
jgi:AcrR family transcriptional regulator